jgi:hypothetical protein
MIPSENKENKGTLKKLSRENLYKRRKRKQRKEKEIPCRIFIELNGYFYRIDNDTMAVNIREAFFSFNWAELSTVTFHFNQPADSFDHMFFLCLESYFY